MPEGNAIKQFRPGTYRVTNRGKRRRDRGGHRFPGLVDGEPQPVEVEITSPRGYLQVKACRDLDVEPVDVDKVADTQETGDDGGSDDGPPTVEALMKAHDRGELDDLARDAGVEDPDSLPNKTAVAEAIIAAEADGS